MLPIYNSFTRPPKLWELCVLVAAGGVIAVSVLIRMGLDSDQCLYPYVDIDSIRRKIEDSNN